MKRFFALLTALLMPSAAFAQTVIPGSQLPQATPASADVLFGIHGGTAGVGGTTSKFLISALNSVLVDLTSNQNVSGIKTFSSPVLINTASTSATPLSLTAASGLTVDAMDVLIGATKTDYFDLNGELHVAPLSGIAIAATGGITSTGSIAAGSGTGATLTAGDLGASRSTTTGAVTIGGSSSAVTCDYGVTTSSVLTCNPAGGLNVNNGTSTNLINLCPSATGCPTSGQTTAAIQVGSAGANNMTYNAIGIGNNTGSNTWADIGTCGSSVITYCTATFGGISSHPSILGIWNCTTLSCASSYTLELSLDTLGDLGVAGNINVNGNANITGYVNSGSTLQGTLSSVSGYAPLAFTASGAATASTIHSARVTTITVSSSTNTGCPSHGTWTGIYCGSATFTAPAAFASYGSAAGTVSGNTMPTFSCGEPWVAGTTAHIFTAPISTTVNLVIDDTATTTIYVTSSAVASQQVGPIICQGP